MAIELNHVEINKDNQKISAFEFNQKLVPPKPIEQIIEISFPTLNAGVVGKYRLPTDINCDLLVKAFTMDVTSDDLESLSDASFQMGSIPILFFLYDYTNNKIVRKIATSFVAQPIANFYLFIEHSLEIQIKSSTKFNSLTFYCEPIYISNKIDAVNQTTT